ncbi:2-succinyl-5-enolpyruvyl-6-hydroxy-3-cyclohexene-1-carboxylic-acid synthase [Hymenobacter properus]|uniref:2-succinyl-5-enolpyruvyl-6-hydroxy-3-cyclohexene-1-carboxylate synthase n=1 Tax=Hymenobacter properus TaxID=2791026 RepID=A0A931BI07_9BACT|nr:2-succinyl-5-enolpyruvyl-6-hydroxy-3-cyclohexene-1-carboxylic-acid synthase [Hymenobacter properus]MBF9144290.1 2-succinyl-5-enolpyruvyl-6-hydroxy-3-cyclohexene-1-carboxylic-acid synthase [Hymenobacter properus]MBR7723108.1 2-succinyl-5-enolpyruvyl-6-hydroxy-3-cyclohexene-1-carboxylic-acid synthase [Microvirga sp. SRT04]
MQAVHNIAEICARHGITDVVLSPGSRSAPLTLAFARHPGLKVRVVPDERAAAFIGLGIAQAQRRAVALVCTSGTAGLNYAPAVAEAYFQRIPLVVFTADRPNEWIDQLDGQTIRQHNLYGAHAKGAFEFPVDTSHADAKWHAARLVNEAINLAQAAPAGPVQVNVPLREPFYPKAGEEIQYDQDVKITLEATPEPVLPAIEAAAFLREIETAKKVLVVAGQHPANPEVQATLAAFATAVGAVVVGDTISNLLPLGDMVIGQQDVFLAGLSKEARADLRPDLLITYGQSLISKSLKLFLRDAAPAAHWHILAHGEAADTFRALTRVIRVEPAGFFHQLAALKTGENTTPGGSSPVGSADAQGHTGSGASELTVAWQQADAAAAEFLNKFFTAKAQPFNEFSGFRQVLAELPFYTALHLANSMAVRYTNILGVPKDREIEVFANRGTSGIDGCNSTAVGAALAQPGRPVVLLTGDVAFFYDRNAFWHNYPTPNLRVVLFNNHGGGIFRLIDGPRQQPELDEFFETRQLLTAENTAKDFNLRYFPVSSFAELEAALPVFFAAETGAAILEVFTDSKTNAAFFEEYRTAVKKAFSKL